MTKKKVLLFAVMVACLFMLFAITAFAANETVSYKVLTANGVMERTTTVGVLFNVSNTNGTRIINGVNSTVDGFAASKIIEVHVPNGIAEVNITIENNSVQTIIFDYYCQTNVSSLKGLKGLKSIVVSGVEAQVTFGTGCAPASLEEVLITAPRATIGFGDSAFAGITNLKTLSLGKAIDPQMPSSFTFGAASFQNTGIEEIVLDDDSATYTFSGANVFSNNTKLRRVHLGKGVKTVGATAFDYCSSLEFVYAHSLTAISSNTFRVNANTEKYHLKVYIHTEQKVTLDANAFNGRSVKGVTVCALETSVTALSNCKYELHYGVQHKYEPASAEPTCYTSYVTDCTCGRVGNAYYKLYSSGASVKTVKLVAGPNPDVPHTYTGAYRMEYENGIENSGVVELKCGVCGALEGIERTASPVVEFLGYSVSESGNYAMVTGVRFNYTSLKLYEEMNGGAIEYGLVMAASGALNGNAPITDKGEAYSNSVYLHNMSNVGLYESTLKLSNIKESMLNTEFVFSAYIKIGDKIVYYQGNGAMESPTAITYSQVLAGK